MIYPLSSAQWSPAQNWIHFWMDKSLEVDEHISLLQKSYVTLDIHSVDLEKEFARLMVTGVEKIQFAQVFFLIIEPCQDIQHNGAPWQYYMDFLVSICFLFWKSKFTFYTNNPLTVKKALSKQGLLQTRRVSLGITRDYNMVHSIRPD